MLTFQILGPLRVAGADGRDVTPPGGLQRRLLLALLAEAGRTVSPDRLAETLWPDDLPADHVAALHTHVFRLRKALPELSVARQPDGYVVDLTGHRLDADAFARSVSEATALRADDPALVLARLDEVLGWWRGEPFGDLPDSDLARADRVRLEELRRRAHDERVEALIDLGRHGEVIADLEALTVEEPTRERPHAQLMRVLVATERSVDALRVFDRFRRVLGEELGMEPSPELRALHDSIVAGTATRPDVTAPASTPASTSPSAPTSAPGPDRTVAAPPLPRLSSLFIGREREVDELATTLGEARLVTLLGTGGVGKTRLAMEVGRQVADRFADGVWLCELAGSTDGNALEAVASQLGIETRAGVSVGDRAAEVLRHRQVLVILDNCEHVLDVIAPLAERLVAMTDHVRVMATSRERLAVDGEQLFPVAPLPTADLDDPAAPAIRLFVDRARAMQPGFAADGPLHTVVAELCRRLDGLPLAIELAAARLSTMDVNEISTEIGRGIGVLSAGRRSAPRHRSLTASMRWSFDLLATDEQDALTDLAVFRGPFTTEGAAAVIGRRPSEARTLLAALAERSLLQRTAGRHSMLEPVRQFAHEQPAAPRSAAVGRHADYHLALVERLRGELRGPDPGAVMRAFDESLIELRAVRDHLATTKDADGLLRLVLNVHEYGVFHMRPEVLLWGVDAAAASDDPRDGRAADALAIAALAAWNRGDRSGFTRLAHDAHALSLERTGGLTAQVADAMGLVGLVDGDLDRARSWYEQAYALFDPANTIRRCETGATALLCLAYSGDPRTEREAEWLLDQIGHPDDGLAAAWAWYGAGEALLDIDPGRAAERLRRAVDHARACEAWLIVGVAAASLASMAARTGDPDQAIEEYRWLIPMWNRGGEASVLWTALRSIAELLARIGQYEAAATLLHAARTTPDGHAVFGEDLARLDRLAVELQQHLGSDACEAAAREGRGLDAADAAEIALRSFDARSAR